MKHTIQINGKHYDALSGELINNPDSTHVVHPQHTSRTAKTTHAIPRRARNHTHTLPNHKGKRSRTLMRKGMKKPVISHSSAHKSVSVPITTIARLHSDASRIARISKIPRSNLITKFGPLTGQGI